MADALDRIQKLVSQLTLPEIGQLIEDLERERDAKLSEARAALLQEVEERSAALGLTAAELIGGGKRTAAAKSTRLSAVKQAAAPAEVRYRDPESGSTWTGNGRIPKWIKQAEASGKSREDFRVGSGEQEAG